MTIKKVQDVVVGDVVRLAGSTVEVTEVRDDGAGVVSITGLWRHMFGAEMTTSEYAVGTDVDVV